MKQTMRLETSQRLSLTPALQQAIRMLQLSTIDLKTEIRAAVESNFMLEVEEPEPVKTDQSDPGDTIKDTGTAAADSNIPDSLPLDTHWDDIYANNASPGPQQNNADSTWRDYQQNNLTQAADLHTHLAWQADMAPFTPVQRQVASHIIDAIDDAGFIADWAELNKQIAQTFELSDTDVERVLTTIQGFDPAGVGARGLAECLGIQLTQLDNGTDGYDLALQLLDGNHLAELAHGHPETLVGKLRVSHDALAQARRLLQTLHPCPGNDYAPTQVDYITPEVFVMRRQGRWQVLLNPDIAPRLRINNEYLALMNDGRAGKDRAALQSQLQEARSFLSGLKSRNETLLRVSRCIVEAQHDFLDYGQEAMKPLVLQDVSNLLDIHESTVSRATANKFVQTPRGIFELKYFFSSHVSSTDGDNVSATAIQAMIKRLIGAEDPAKPLSDSKLAAMLRDNAGIKLARRTVAKYREKMDIAPTHQRKRKSV